jgi:hypothetical protein
MLQKKTLQQREKELQSWLVTPVGRKELQDLAARYAAMSGKLRPAGKSAITYILVYEREQGLLAVDRTVADCSTARM